MQLRDLMGERFGRLTVIGRARNKGRRAVWACRCDCGQAALAHGHDLTAGKQRSCGCLRRELLTRHGNTSSTGWVSGEYQSWVTMKTRCLSPKATAYHRYGGRGITVCDRWLHSFETFLADMGPKLTPQHSLDRIDNDGNYEPGNCRWATRVEQQANTRFSRAVEHNGERRSLNEWARLRGIAQTTLSYRLRKGWSIEQALGTPPHGRP